MTTAQPKLWTPGDWNAFFGFGTNILVNLLTLTALLRFVLKMPDDLVFGRILPASGMMLCLSTLYYAWLAYSLAKKTGRTDVCALPSGISVPHMFVVTFVIMLPIAAKTGNPIRGWEAGLTWVFIQSFVLMVGGFIAPIIRRTDLPPSVFGYLLSNQLVKLFQTLWCRHVICPFYSCISPHLTIKWLNLPSSYLPMFSASYDVGRRDPTNFLLSD